MDGGQKDLGWLLSQQTFGDLVAEYLNAYLDQNHQNQNQNKNQNQNQNHQNQKVHGGLPLQLPQWPLQLLPQELVKLPAKSFELPPLSATFDNGQKDDKVPDQLKKKGGEGRQLLVNENSDLDLTPTFNLTTAPLWELLALALSTAMVVITGATLLRSYDLEKFETVMAAGCKKVLGRRGTMSSCKTTEKTRGEMTRDKVGRQTEQTDAMMANLCHLSSLTISASLATIFLSGTDRLNAQSGIDINYERTRVNDQLKRSFIEVTV
jgi:hypothetical protein